MLIPLLNFSNKFGILSLKIERGFFMDDIDLSNFKFTVPPLIKTETYPEIFDHTVGPLDYEDTFFKTMAEDIKNGYSKELETTNRYLREQLELASHQARDAQKEARISKIIAIISMVIAIAGVIIPIFL